MGCDALQGDHFVHGPNGPFFPQSKEDLRRSTTTGEGAYLLDPPVPVNLYGMGRVSCQAERRNIQNYRRNQFYSMGYTAVFRFLLQASVSGMSNQPLTAQLPYCRSKKYSQHDHRGST